MFMAKCIQDGRRMDLPLSLPFFKLMCTSWERDNTGNRESVVDEEEEVMVVREEGEQVTHMLSQNISRQLGRTAETTNDEDSDCDRNVTTSLEEHRREINSDILILDTTGVGSANEASRPQYHGEAGVKEVELVLANHMTEISKDGGPKDRVTLEQVEGEGLEERGWFEDILDCADLLEVSQYQGKFLQQLDLLVQERDAIRSKENLSSQEKEREISRLTLPGSEENIPGTSLENLWLVVIDRCSHISFRPNYLKK